MSSFKYGPTKYAKIAELTFAHYQVGSAQTERIALMGVDPDTSEPVHTCTVNFPELDVLPGHVWIKSWGENEGVLEALIKAKIGTVTGRTARAGHMHAHELKLSRSVLRAARFAIQEQVMRRGRRAARTQEAQEAGKGK